MQTISYGQVPIATMTSFDVGGEQGLGTAQLIVSLHLMMQPGTVIQGKPTVPRITAIHGDLVIPGAYVSALQAVPLNLRCPPPGQHALEQPPTRLRAWLSAAQVRALDLARDKDGGFDLHLDLTLQVTGHDGPATSQVRSAKQITGSDWSRILREMRFEDRASFEVPVGGGRVVAPLDKAAKHMRDALDQLQKHDWPDALVKCRAVLDELGQHQRVTTPPWADWDDKTKREGWGIPERVVAMQAAVRHLMHPGAHAVGNADEHEVRMAVRLTGAVLAYYASR